MMRPALSRAASGLLRALLARAGVDSDRILLAYFRSTDWQSLTFIGERHEIGLRLPAPGAAETLTRLTDGLGQCEWRVPGQIVADIAVAGNAECADDGSIGVTIEALTIVE
jgi:hypothetical protein